MPLASSAESSTTLRALRWQWLLATVLCAGALGLAGTWLATIWPPSLIGRWAVAAAAVLAYELWLLWRNLDRHRSPQSGELLPHLGLGNALTLYRGLANGLLAGFLLAPWPQGGLLAWLPALLYTSAAIADFFDGYTARRLGHASALGETLDQEFDALGVLVVVAVAVHFGQWPLWFLAVGVARYAFLGGVALRRRLGKPVYELPPSPIRRPLAGLQMGLLTVVLWPVATPAIMTLAGLFFALPFLAGFLRDWLAVSGLLDPDSPRYQRAERALLDLFTGWLATLVRLLAAAAVAAALIETAGHFQQRVLDFERFGFGWPLFVTALFLMIEIVALPFLALGAAARFCALLLTMPIGFTIVAAGFAPERTAALAGILYVVVFGAGRYALWQPEERFFGRRLGAPPESKT